MAGNLEVTDLPLIPAVDGADVYAAKNNLDYRVRTGEAGGLATLDGTAKLPASQMPTNFGAITLTNATFTGSPQFIKADFNNATLGNRFYFQPTSAGGASVGILPAGAGTAAFMTAYGSTDPANTHSGSFGISATATFINSTKAGTGVTKPMSFQFDGIERVSVGTDGTITSLGNIQAAGQAFTGGGNVILGTTGAGGVFLRPNGTGSTTAQAVLQTSGFNINTSIAVYSTGAVGTQQIITSYGYNNGVPRWKNVIEPTGALSVYAYDTGGGTPTPVMTMYSTVAGGIQRITGQGVIEAAGAGAGVQFNDRTSGRTWMWYGVSDSANLFNGSGNIINVTTGGVVTATNFVATSDRDLKTGITDKSARRGLADKLHLVDFIWKSTGNKDQGLIAQEVRDIAPEYVHTNSEGTLAIDKVGLLLECVVDLAARVRELEAK